MQPTRRVVEIWYNGQRELCRAFNGTGDADAAVRVSKRRVCRKYGVDPKSTEGKRMMGLMIADVDHPESVPAISENMGGEG